MKTSAILLSATAAIVSASDYGCTEGAMRCSGTGFETCNFNNWVYRPCGPATQCFMVNGNFPTCGYPQSNYAPQPPTYQQQPPAYQQPPSYQPQQSYQQPPPQQSYQSKSNFASTQQYQQPAYGGQQQSYCTEGAMKCDGTGFSTCNFNNWVYRPCGTGTECFMVSDNHPTCGWPKSPSYGQTPSYPTNQYTPQPYTPSPPPPQPYTPPTPPSYTPQPRKDYTPPTPPSYTPQPRKDYTPPTPPSYTPQSPKDYTPAPKCDNLYGFCVCSASYTAGYVKGSDCLEYGWENNASCVKKGGVKCEKSQPPTYGQSQPPAPSYGSSQPPAPSYGNSQPPAPSYGSSPAPSYGQGQPQYHKK